jgi:hypothetical protein
MRPGTSTLHLMDQSKKFNYFFYGSIIVIFFAFALTVFFPFTQHLCNSCPNSSFNKNKCDLNGITFCCPDGAPSCGNLYCQTVVDDYCYGVIIASGVLYAIGFILGVLALTMFCSYKQRVRSNAYLMTVDGQPPLL